MTTIDTILYYISVGTLLYILAGTILFIILLPTLTALATVTVGSGDKRKEIIALSAKTGMVRLYAAESFMVCFPIHWGAYLTYVFQKDT